MLSRERQQQILRRLRTNGAVKCSQMADELGVSPMTIRRDVEEMARRGLLVRVHGGAIPLGQTVVEPAFASLPSEQAEDKGMIARRAVELVTPGEVIGIGGGSTAYAFAQALFESDNSAGITILTNSLPVASLVENLKNRDIEVILTGGVTTRFRSLIGPVANQTIASLRVAALFLGAHAVKVPQGFFTPNSLEASTDKAFIASADRTIMLADHTKWSNTSLSLFASFSDVDTIVTDSGLSREDLERTRALCENIIVS